MLKRVFSGLLVLAFVITAIPFIGLTTAFAAEQEGVLFYIKTNNFTAIQITDCDTSASGSLVIPSEINGLPVTSIGGNAFRGCSLLTNVTIPNTVTSIGYGAFYACTSFTSLTIPNSVTSIGGNAFNSCSSLTGITLPNSVTSIGGNAFYKCSALTSIAIPYGVTGIESETFRKCSSLTNITIPNTVTRLENYAFAECSSLTKITIPSSMIKIGNYAFYYCTALKSIIIPESVMSIGNSAFFNCSSLESVTLRKGVTSIGEQAFSNCSSLANVTIPSSVTSIAGYVFNNCPLLTSVTIPKSVTTMGYGIFIGVNRDFVMNCFENSAAKTYATNNNLSYNLIDWFTVSDHSAYSVNDDLYRFYAKTGKTKASAVLFGLQNTNIEIYKDGTKILGNTSVGTGCVLKMIENGTVIGSLKVVVKGDLSGDGAVDALDVFLANNALNNHSTLTDVYLDAANLDTANAEFNVSDYSNLLNLAVGKAI